MADQGKPREPVWVSATSLALLGPLRLSNSAGDDLTPKTRKSRALLAIVALARSPVPRSRLGDLLWGDRAEEQAKASLRQALYELRSLTSSGALCPDRQAVSLVAAKLPTDLAEIERAIANNDFARLASALESVRWPLLSDLDDLTPELDEWLRDERTRVASLILHGAAELGNSALAAGKPAEARRIADAVERIDPLDECSARVGARADLALGDRTAAHRRLGRIAVRLKDQLGIDLAPETKTLLADETPPPSAAKKALVAAQPQQGRPSKRTVVVLLLLAIAAAVTLYLAWPRPVPANPTVAVLPFEQIGQKQGYFASGVSDEILNLLARQKQFKVLGRVSAAQLADPEKSLETARKLDVAYLLDGSVRTAGDRVLVIARLTRVSDGAQIWSERYERRAGDIFAVQGEIAGAVASRLAQSLTGVRPQETSPAVYDRYLAARQLSRERRDTTLAEGERLLREAIKLDPGYAPAYAELAQVIMLRTDHPTAYGSIPFAQGQREAEPFARKAVALDPALGDGYASVGFLSLSLDGSAEPFLRKAVELSPQRADFHRWHAQTLMMLNRYDEAIAEYKRAVEIDPLWELSYDHLIGALYLIGREKEGRDYARRFFSLSTDQRAKLMLVKVLHGFGLDVAAELKVAQTLYRAYPDERTSRLNYGSPLALLGERRAAAPVVAYDPIATAALRGDWGALARASEALGSQFWDRAGMWNASELLVASGHGDSLVRLYDQVKPQLDREQIDPNKIALPEVIIALRQAGRRADAERLFALYRDHNAELPTRGLLGEDKSVNLGVIALLSGDRETAIHTLDLWSRRKPLRLLHIPAMALRYDPLFAPLANDPRFPAIEERIRIAVNVQRAKAGFPAITREAWIGDNQTLLTRN